ncbi:uncharacterized protein [Amphiura filiformis]|uniref:uncharacterized protein n=1 Tax=Amphiura filiformis TaxID=82378 RepID=UPI003B218076
MVFYQDKMMKESLLLLVLLLHGNYALESKYNCICTCQKTDLTDQCQRYAEPVSSSQVSSPFSPQNYGCDINSLATCQTSDYRTFFIRGGYTACLDTTWSCCKLESSVACFTSDVTSTCSYGDVRVDQSCYSLYCRCTSTSSVSVNTPPTQASAALTSSSFSNSSESSVTMVTAQLVPQTTEAPSTNDNKQDVVIIIGTTIGATILIVIVVALLVCCLCHRQVEKKPDINQDQQERSRIESDTRLYEQVKDLNLEEPLHPNHKSQVTVADETQLSVLQSSEDGGYVECRPTGSIPNTSSVNSPPPLPQGNPSSSQDDDGAYGNQTIINQRNQRLGTN